LLEGRGGSVAGDWVPRVVLTLCDWCPGLRCPHQDITQCPNFNSGVTARLAGQPLSRSHQQLHGRRFRHVTDG